MADRIPGRNPGDDPDKRQSLLPVRPDDLDEELWRVDFDGEMPCLVVNDQLANWKETASDPWFRAVVFPAAMRRILDRILLVDKNTATDGDDWQSQWLRFASTLPGSSSIPRNNDEHDDWIETATAAFARRHRLRSGCKAAEGE